jgi:hypothetical protein
VLVLVDGIIRVRLTAMVLEGGQGRGQAHIWIVFHSQVTQMELMWDQPLDRKIMVGVVRKLTVIPPAGIRTKSIYENTLLHRQVVNQIVVLI